MRPVAIYSGAATPPYGGGAESGSELKDWLSLLKPRVMTLVVFTGLIGALLAPGLHSVVTIVASTLCIAVSAGACGSINMWYDRDIDRIMRRTASRPIPGLRIDPADALGFGVLLALASVITMFLATNIVAAIVLALSIIFYVGVYSMWLKRRTPMNIVIGGAAGAFPPVIGWAAITGQIGLLPSLLFAIIFFWTPPHFWALALYANSDYTRAGVPMLPVTAGYRATRKHMVVYTLILVLVAMTPWTLGLTGPIYGIAATALNLGFVVHALRTLRDKQDPRGMSLTGDAPARRMFRFSLVYLFTLFSALVVDALVA